MEQFIQEKYRQQRQIQQNYFDKHPALYPIDRIASKYLFRDGTNFTCYFHPNETASNEPHSHDFFELIYVYSGTVRNWVNDEFLTLNAGDLCLMNPETMHYLEYTPEELIVINFLIRKEFQESILFNLSNSSNLVFNFFVDCTHHDRSRPYLLVQKGAYSLQTIQYLHAAIAESMEPGPMSREFLYHNFTLFCLELTRNHIRHQNDQLEPQLSKDTLEEIVSYIITHCQTITLDSLAAHFHYNRTYLPRLLKTRTDKSFTEIRQLARIELAKDILRHTDLDIASVSAKVGYSSEGQLAQVFKTHVGMTPAQYRKTK